MLRPTRNLIAAAMVTAMLGAPHASARELVSEDFESLAPSVGSSLTGLNGWNSWFTQSALVANGAGANTSIVATTPSPSTNNTGNRKVHANFDLAATEIAVLEFDAFVAVNGSAATAMFSLGNNGGNPGPLVGIQFGTFAVRADNWGTATNAVTSGGSSFTPVANTWYRIRSEWDTAAATANLFVRDLSGTDANVTDGAFQQLFFNAARTTSTATLGTLSNIANWNEARIRLGGNNGTGTVDNLQATAADVLANYNFGTAAPIPLTSSGHIAASSPGSFAFGPGTLGNITDGSANGNPTRSVFIDGTSLNQPDEASAITSNDYVTFNVAPTAGFELSLTELTFDFQRDGLDSVTNWSLRSDAAGDNFATQIATGALTPTVGLSGNTGVNFFRYTIDLSNLAMLQDLTDAASFRLYLWGAASTNVNDTNKARIDNVILYGHAAASAIPEPASAVLLVGFLAALGRRIRETT